MIIDEKKRKKGTKLTWRYPAVPTESSDHSVSRKKQKFAAWTNIHCSVTSLYTQQYLFQGFHFNVLDTVGGRKNRRLKKDDFTMIQESICKKREVFFYLFNN